MSIPYSGTIRRSVGVVSAIGKQLNSVNLKAAKRITVIFDPFSDNVKHTRYLEQLLSIHAFIYISVGQHLSTRGLLCLILYFLSIFR